MHIKIFLVASPVPCAQDRQAISSKSTHNPFHLLNRSQTDVNQSHQIIKNFFFFGTQGNIIISTLDNHTQRTKQKTVGDNKNIRAQLKSEMGKSRSNKVKQTTNKGATTKNSDGSNNSNNNNAASNTSSSGTNRPKNHLITDATQPYTFTFGRFGTAQSITVNQTPKEDVWPGGALWDLGVLLAQVLVLLTKNATMSRNNNRLPPIPDRLLNANLDITWKDTRVLELGCGVGLTGLVAAALGAKATLLTDLGVVIDGITQENVEINTTVGPSKTCGYRSTRSGGRVVAMPLAWGVVDDEQATATMLERIAPFSKSGSSSGGSGRRKKGNKDSAGAVATRKTEGIPDLIIIGDVAYQHKPGAPSHFDILLSSLLKFLDNDTLVVFGTRMRMPASADLLDMFHDHMDEVVVPPIEAHELDPSFGSGELGRKHNMTIHFLKKKKKNIPENV